MLKKNISSYFLCLSNKRNFQFLKLNFKYFCDIQNKIKIENTSEILQNSSSSSSLNSSSLEESSTNHLNSHSHASKCWQCGKRQNCCHLFCSNCGKIQAVGSSCCNYFKLLDMPVSFKVDERSLEKKYKEIQKITHPDKYSMASEMERNASTVSSSTINQAYQALRCPVDRAKYLLALQGINALNEDSSFDDPQLMMDIFELRESIEDLKYSKNIEGLKKLLQELKDEATTLCDIIESTYQEKRLNETTRASVKLKYISKAIEEVMAIIPS